MANITTLNIRQYCWILMAVYQQNIDWISCMFWSQICVGRGYWSHQWGQRVDVTAVDGESLEHQRQFSEELVRDWLAAGTVDNDEHQLASSDDRTHATNSNVTGVKSCFSRLALRFSRWISATPLAGVTGSVTGFIEGRTGRTHSASRGDWFCDRFHRKSNWTHDIEAPVVRRNSDAQSNIDRTLVTIDENK